jgi:hypothetical protein
LKKETAVEESKPETKGTEMRYLFVLPAILALCPVSWAQPKETEKECRERRDKAISLAKQRSDLDLELIQKHQKIILGLADQREKTAITEALNEAAGDAVYTSQVEVPYRLIVGGYEDIGNAVALGTFRRATRPAAKKLAEAPKGRVLPKIGRKEISFVNNLNAQELAKVLDGLSGEISEDMSRLNKSFQTLIDAARADGNKGRELALTVQQSEMMQDIALFDKRLQTAGLERLKKACDSATGFIDDSTRPHDRDISKNKAGGSYLPPLHKAPPDSREPASSPVE